MSDNTLPIAVLGGGIIGLCTAVNLLRDGHRVLVIDRGDAQAAASYGNAGCLNGSSIVPNSSPDVMRRVPRWLFDSEGPLVLRAGYLPFMLPWLLRFAASGRREAIEKQAVALRALLGSSLDETLALARETGLSPLIRPVGHTVAYTTSEGFRADGVAMSLRERNGVHVEVLDRHALRARDPHLSDQFVAGRYIAETGHVGDPGAFLAGLRHHITSQGGRFVDTEIKTLETDGSAVTSVVTASGAMPVKCVVIALGAWSKTLAQRLGDKVLLDTERGYHIEVPEAPVAPSTPTLWSEAKMFVTPMDGRVRCAGTVEFAGLARGPDWRRCDLLARQLGRMYPGIGAHLQHRPVAPERRWLGFRPSTPDSLPVLGRASRMANAYYAFGHGHVGLTAGAASGRIVADLVAGRTTSIDLEPFSIARFA
ncbi:FAD-binding oxidoreductase [Pandoraea sp. ISTKB]|uniref:NAD(P)/FAD-dependent oxidoreductase n=1 Tax=Pandoraea sp. ISTKB TaxID=1586708 RepID=UPI0008468B94|nr:FAD-dependent oxidoreductase [Pandoraea sp. ISTKB]ODP34476.1 hypothetical protein A9762_14935 [Pandoraea sp. ISTKB]